MTLDEKIAEAEAAMHDLATGKQVRVVVDQSGERIEFTASSAARLRGYVEDLKAQKAGSTRRGPMGIIL